MSPRAQRRPGELAFAVALLAFSLWLFAEAYKISGFSGLSTPGVFPMLASGLMIASSLAILVKVLAMGPAGGGLRRFLADITPLRQAVMVPVNTCVSGSTGAELFISRSIPLSLPPGHLMDRSTPAALRELARPASIDI